jgi:hypothetical protein
VTLHNILKLAPISKHSYVLFSLIGTVVLLLVHWNHSWPALSQGRVFSDLGDSRQADPVNEAIQTVTLASLFGLYFYCLAYWERLQFTMREVVVIGVAQWLIGWAALPANSTDIFGYIGLGRMAGIYGVNPYLHTYAEFPDAYTPYIEWDITMPYGPVLLPVFAVAGWLSRHSVLASVFGLKLVWLLTHVCNCRVLFQILKGWGIAPAFGLFLFALNPLVWLEQIVNGHNDGVLILFGLLAIFALQRGWQVAAILLALLSSLVKLPGIFFFVLARKREWRVLAGGLLGSAILLPALKLALFPTKESLLSLTNVGNYTKNSLHTFLILLAEKFSSWLGAPMDYDALYRLDRRIFTILFFGFCAWRCWRVRELNSLVQELAVLFLGLLIGYVTWFFPWYVAWLVPLAALVESARLRWTILTFSWTALMLYAFPHHLIELSPQHWFWAALRISIVHLLPMSLLLRAITETPAKLRGT